MKKIIAFTASNSSTSINKKLINYTSTIIPNAEVNVIDLREFELPIYGVDLEKEIGVPENIKNLIALFEGVDGVIVSTPEHNGLMPAFFKNTLDWLSRSGVKYLEGSKLIVLGTSPGRGGAQKGIDAVAKVMPYGGGELLGTFSLPQFNENFVDGKIVNEEMNAELKTLVASI